MKQVKLLFGVLSIVLATSLTTVAQNGNPNGNGQSTGTVVGVENDGTIIVVDNETGTIRLIAPSDLTLNISMGEEVMFIFITTPNGNEVVRVIKRN